MIEMLMDKVRELEARLAKLEFAKALEQAPPPPPDLPVIPPPMISEETPPMPSEENE